jgi:hypothetical protein
MVQSYSEETGSCTSAGGFAYLVWNTKPYNPLHKDMPLDFNLDLLKPVHNLSHWYYKYLS